MSAEAQDTKSSEKKSSLKGKDAAALDSFNFIKLISYSEDENFLEKVRKYINSNTLINRGLKLGVKEILVKDISAKLKTKEIVARINEEIKVLELENEELSLRNIKESAKIQMPKIDWNNFKLSLNESITLIEQGNSKEIVDHLSSEEDKRILHSEISQAEIANLNYLEEDYFFTNIDSVTNFLNAYVTAISKALGLQDDLKIKFSNDIKEIGAYIEGQRKVEINPAKITMYLPDLRQQDNINLIFDRILIAISHELYHHRESTFDKVQAKEGDSIQKYALDPDPEKRELYFNSVSEKSAEIFAIRAIIEFKKRFKLEHLIG